MKLGLLRLLEDSNSDSQGAYANLRDVNEYNSLQDIIMNLFEFETLNLPSYEFT